MGWKHPFPLISTSSRFISSIQASRDAAGCDVLFIWASDIFTSTDLTHNSRLKIAHILTTVKKLYSELFLSYISHIFPYWVIRKAERNRRMLERKVVNHCYLADPHILHNKCSLWLVIFLIHILSHPNWGLNWRGILKCKWQYIDDHKLRATESFSVCKSTFEGSYTWIHESRIRFDLAILMMPTLVSESALLIFSICFGFWTPEVTCHFWPESCSRTH